MSRQAVLRDVSLSRQGTFVLTARYSGDATHVPNTGSVIVSVGGPVPVSASLHLKLQGISLANPINHTYGPGVEPMVSGDVNGGPLDENNKVVRATGLVEFFIDGMLSATANLTDGHLDAVAGKVPPSGVAGGIVHHLVVRYDGDAFHVSAELGTFLFAD
jgi:hypothetical protein